MVRGFVSNPYTEVPEVIAETEAVEAQPIVAVAVDVVPTAPEPQIWEPNTPRLRGFISNPYAFLEPDVVDVVEEPTQVTEVPAEIPEEPAQVVEVTEIPEEPTQVTEVPAEVPEEPTQVSEVSEVPVKAKPGRKKKIVV